jgi:parvulin-like peptidyl-prolyl isomerase
MKSLAAVALFGVTACAPLATSPAWAGGGMAVTGPIGIPEIDIEVTSAPAGSEESSEKIGARHILVMHAKSQARTDGVTRSRAEALVRANECRDKLRQGADFSEMVDQYSDEPGASERGGELGTFARNAMVKPFSDAAFRLKVGELSDVVETPYGFHIIKRTR